MEYSNDIINAATEIFKKGITNDLCSGIYPQHKDEKDIDWEFEIEYFLDKFCVACGTEQVILDYYKSEIEEEVARRMNLFTCETEEAKDFLQTQIREYVKGSPSFAKPDTLFSSIHDIDNKTLFSWQNELDGEKIYLLMDFEEAETDYVYWSNEDFLDSFAQTSIISKATE